jgi:hypothetical protein
MFLFLLVFLKVKTPPKWSENVSRVLNVNSFGGCRLAPYKNQNVFYLSDDSGRIASEEEI